MQPVRFLLYYTGFTLLGLAYWITEFFGEVTVEQIFYHAYFAEEAAIRMTGAFAVVFGLNVLLFPLVSATLGTWLHRSIARRWSVRGRRILKVTPVLLMFAGVASVLLTIPIFGYAAALLRPDDFVSAYADPGSMHLVNSGQKRNLVLIYAESLEQTYSEAQVFGQDLLEPLTRLHGARFADYRQVHGTGWTIAGIVATQCGIPLVAWGSRYGELQSRGRSFLPGARCLGDVLSDQGYRNVFMGGAPLSFAAKGTFLRDHGYHAAFGRVEWDKAGLSHKMNDWGLTDESLFEQARKQLDELHASDQPFNLTLLTVDTHGPEGYPSPRCKGPSGDYKAVVQCAGQQLSEFAQYMQQRGYLQDTVLVIVGDHLVHGNPIGPELGSVEHRRIFNLILSDPLPRLSDHSAVPFDMLPTLMELLGTPVPGGRLGLGSSRVYSSEPRRPQPEVNLLGLSRSAAYNQLWQP